MTDEDLVEITRTIEVISKHAFLTATVEDADRCMNVMNLLDAASQGELVMIRQILREHILLKMKDAVQSEKRTKRQEGVYAIEFSDGLVKIGRTRNYSQRFGMLRNQSATPVTQDRFFPCYRSSNVETAAHRNFSASRVKNEFFQISFSDACEFLEFATGLRQPCNAVN